MVETQLDTLLSLYQTFHRPHKIFIMQKYVRKVSHAFCMEYSILGPSKSPSSETTSLRSKFFFIKCLRILSSSYPESFIQIAWAVSEIKKKWERKKERNVYQFYYLKSIEFGRFVWKFFIFENSYLGFQSTDFDKL